MFNLESVCAYFSLVARETFVTFRLVCNLRITYVIEIWEKSIESIKQLNYRIISLFPKLQKTQENHGKDREFRKSDQILHRTKRNVNKLCLEKVSVQKTIITNFSIDSRFLI